MTDRYTKLFYLEKNLYTAGSPVLIEAGALLLDSFSASMLAQLKFKNISSGLIKAMSVKIVMLDISGRVLDEPVVYQYLDLNAARDEEFGPKTAIVLPNANVRSFTVDVTELVFSDGGMWGSEGAAWSPLEAQLSLKEVYGDEELANQYQIRYGSDCVYSPLEDSDLWFCTCGGVNHAEEKNCHLCRRTLSAQKSVNLSALRSECAERLKAEEEQRQQEQELNKEKRKKQLRLAMIIAPILIVAILLLATVPRALERQRAYNSAAALLAENRFDEAAQAFTALGDYKDSAQQAEMETPYRLALYIMECAENRDDAALSLAGLSRAEVTEETLSEQLYLAAISHFELLGDYKDSPDRIAQCEAAIEALHASEIQAQYDEALALLESGAYCQSRDAFTALKGYSDSRNMAREAIYRKAVALYGFMEKYDVRNVYVSISTLTGQDSVFSIEKNAALELGSDCIPELRAACGADEADIRLEDTPAEGLVPYTEGLIELFSSLGEYSDSADYIQKIQDIMDYTKDFYSLCSQGDVYGAYDWLSAYEGEFEGRERWLELLEMYKPFCDSWALYSGDSTLLPLTVGQSLPCGAFSSCVIIGDDAATLRISVSGDAEYTIDLQTELGDRRFVYSDGGPFNYFAVVSNLDRFAYMKYDANGTLRSSCEYERAY